MKYVYFIYYVYNKRGDLYHGNCDVTLTKPITDKDDIDSIATTLKEARSCAHLPVIQNFILLRTEENHPAETH